MLHRPRKNISDVPLNLSKACIDTMFPDGRVSTPAETFVPDELSNLPDYDTFIEEFLHVPTLNVSDGEVLKCDPLVINDVVTNDCDQTLADSIDVDVKPQIGTIALVMAGDIEQSDIPVGSISENNSEAIASEEHPVSSILATNSEEQHPVGTDREQTDEAHSEDGTSFADPKETESKDTSCTESNVQNTESISDSVAENNVQPCTPERDDNLSSEKETTEDHDQQWENASSENNIGTEPSDEPMDAQNTEKETEESTNQMVVPDQQSENASSENNIGTEPSDEPMDAQNTEKETEESTNQMVVPDQQSENDDASSAPVDQTELNEETDIDKDSVSGEPTDINTASTQETNNQRSDNVQEEGDASAQPTANSLEIEQPDEPNKDQNSTIASGNDSDSESAVDIDSDGCSCSSSCTCSSSSSSSSEEDIPKTRGKRKYSDSESSDSDQSDIPLSKLRKNLSGKKPNYKEDTSSDNNSDMEGQKDPDYSDSEKTESYSEDEVIETKTKKSKKKVITTKGGTIEIKHYKLKSKKIRKRKYKCKYCGEISSTQKEHNSHVRKKHKNSKFICFHCDRTFDSDNALYKHERSHYNLPYGCPECDKRFQFPYQVKTHMKVHTQKNLYQCLHCKRKFTTNLSMLTHAKTHFEKWTCLHKDCITSDKKYNSEYNLKQHTRGKHGKGWTALCGDHFKWKSKYNRHLKKCLECIALRKQKDKKRYHFK